MLVLATAMAAAVLSLLFFLPRLLSFLQPLKRKQVRITERLEWENERTSWSRERESLLQHIAVLEQRQAAQAQKLRDLVAAAGKQLGELLTERLQLDAREQHLDAAEAQLEAKMRERATAMMEDRKRFEVTAAENAARAKYSVLNEAQVDKERREWEEQLSILRQEWRLREKGRQQQQEQRIAMRAQRDVARQEDLAKRKHLREAQRARREQLKAERETIAAKLNSILDSDTT